jgi:putative tryptophan/tyrosine transport system substrate-binding protein
MRRRDFLTLLGAAVLPETASAQTNPKVHRLGFLGVTSASSWASRFEAFQSGLREVGYDPGKSILIDALWAEEQYDRLPVLAADLVRRKVDIVLTYGTPGTLAAKRATTEIPIVFAYAGDAVGAGLVSNLPRPERNVTGNTYFLSELMVKRLELLKEAIPTITRAAVLVKPDNPLFKTTLPALQQAADTLKIELKPYDARDPADFEPVMTAMVKDHVQGLVIQEDAVYLTNLKRIVDLATTRSLPVASSSEFAEAGALITYGADFLSMCRHAAHFVDKILRGAKPAELPVNRATTFETILNTRAAKSLGLTLSSMILLRADRVIE